MNILEILYNILQPQLTVPNLYAGVAKDEYKRQIAETLEMNVVKNDPPLKRQTKNNEYRSLDEALDCDIVTFHVPLNNEGVDKTYHLLNSSNIFGMNSLLIPMPVSLTVM